MDLEMFEFLSLSGRYLFTGLMALIVLRAVRGALVDSRRAAKLRRLSPMTGLSGELVVLDGEQKARRGMRYAVIREGLIGSSRLADIRIRHSSVRRRHAYFQLSREGLRLQSHAGARIFDRRGRACRELMLGDGGIVRIGDVRLLLVFSLPDAPVDSALLEEPDRDALFATDDAGDPFSPAERKRLPRRRTEDMPRRSGQPHQRRGAPSGEPMDIDALFETEEGP